MYHTLKINPVSNILCTCYGLFIHLFTLCSTGTLWKRQWKTTEDVVYNVLRYFKRSRQQVLTCYRYSTKGQSSLSDLNSKEQNDAHTKVPSETRIILHKLKYSPVNLKLETEGPHSSPKWKCTHHKQTSGSTSSVPPLCCKWTAPFWNLTQWVRGQYILKSGGGVSGMHKSEGVWLRGGWGSCNHMWRCCCWVECPIHSSCSPKGDWLTYMFK